MNNITLDTYDIFREIYESGSLTRTAEKLHIAQPSISYRIKLLETALGVKLFNRTTRGMEATNVADELYANIKGALDSIKCAERNIIEENKNGEGDIFIGVQHHIGKFFLTKLIKEYAKAFPNVKIHIITKGTAALIDELEQGKLDFIIDTLPISSNKVQLKMKEIAKFHTCFVKKAGAPQKYILPVIGSTMRTQIEQVLQEKNVIIKPDYEVYTTEIMIELVKEGMGIAYTIKEFIEKEFSEKGCLDELEYSNTVDELPVLSCCIAYVDKKQSYLVKKFMELLMLEEKNN